MLFWNVLVFSGFRSGRMNRELRDGEVKNYCLCEKRKMEILEHLLNWSLIQPEV